MQVPKEQETETTKPAVRGFCRFGNKRRCSCNIQHAIVLPAIMLIGVCGESCLRGDERLTVDQAMNQVDQALYEAKREGRNRTVVYDAGRIRAGRERDHA